jgi:hypothetical protein
MIYVFQWGAKIIENFKVVTISEAVGRGTFAESYRGYGLQFKDNLKILSQDGQQINLDSK